MMARYFYNDRYHATPMKSSPLPKLELKVEERLEQANRRGDSSKEVRFWYEVDLSHFSGKATVFFGGA